MHLRCQTPLFFAPLSVAKSCRYRCRDLQRWKCRRKSLRRDVDNCHHHSWNQHLTPAVAESTAPVVKPLTFPAEIPLRALHPSQTRTTPECPSPTAGAKRRPARACRRRNPLVDLNPYRAISVHRSSAARFPSSATENPARTSALTLVGLPVTALIGHHTVRAFASRHPSLARRSSVCRSNLIRVAAPTHAASSESVSGRSPTHSSFSWAAALATAFQCAMAISCTQRR